MVEIPKHLKKVKQEQIFHFSLFTFHYFLYLCTRLRKARAFSSAGLEHLPYKQRVGGSNPSTPTKKSSEMFSELFLYFVLPPSSLNLPPSYIVLHPSSFVLLTSSISLTAASTVGMSAIDMERRPFCSRNWQRRGLRATKERMLSKAWL